MSNGRRITDYPEPIIGQSDVASLFKKGYSATRKSARFLGQKSKVRFPFSVGDAGRVRQIKFATGRT
ncbi:MULTISPECIES: hypothetical protein [unclassified Moorena]|uniref:hypothetical protein n=1 Tax=unclassified Moorena TaxID=2683338 RepID=UPI0013C1B6F0|nr:MULTISPECIES: hypothetical protein [unclassified Moorena]NEP33910.1 hypothetical protein [Moorena sp. SIO3B2]NET69058.1 hypothetical protein [Moorena sp. SIO1G6]